MVTASPGGAWGRAAAGRTNDSGSYALEGLMADTYQVTVMADGAPPLRRSVEVTADTTLDIDAPAARISGTVVEAGSGPHTIRLLVDCGFGAGWTWGAYGGLPQLQPNS